MELIFLGLSGAFLKLYICAPSAPYHIMVSFEVWLYHDIFIPQYSCTEIAGV